MSGQLSLSRQYFKDVFAISLKLFSVGALPKVQRDFCPPVIGIGGPFPEQFVEHILPEKTAGWVSVWAFGFDLFPKFD
jgi:hypothetical protein